MKSLTHLEIVNNGLCVLEDDIILFDMRQFKINPHSVDGKCIAKVACISPQTLNLFVASLQLYQAVTADAHDCQKLCNELADLINQRLTFAQASPIIKRLEDMMQRAKLVTDIATLGGHKVAEQMGLIEPMDIDSHPEHETPQ